MIEAEEITENVRVWRIEVDNIVIYAVMDEGELIFAYKKLEVSS